MPVVYFPLWGERFLLVADDSFAFQVSEMCTTILIIQLSLSQNGEGTNVIGYLQCLIFSSGIGMNNFLSKDIDIYCNIT